MSDIPPDLETYHNLMGVEFVGSTFPDEEIMRNLGILDQVKNILRNMGIPSVFNMAYEAYQQPTCMFLASLQVRSVNEPVNDRTNGGFITFKDVYGRIHTITFRELEHIYGFNAMKSQPATFDVNPREIALIWQIIGSNAYREGRNKSNLIRHPAVRYVHQILANSFFARADTTYVLGEEMKFLSLGIAPLVGEFLQDRSLFTALYNKRPCPLKLFLKQLAKHHNPNWASQQRGTPQLRVGGWITPILQYTQVYLGRMDRISKTMNYAYLADIQFLVGGSGEQFYYQFKRISTTKGVILLPNSRRTSFRRRENIVFSHEYSTDQDVIEHATTLESYSDNLSNLSLEGESSNSQNGSN